MEKEIELEKENITIGEFPEGTLNITENGEYNIKSYANVDVDVPVGVFPSGTLDINENGVYNVTEYKEANVDIAIGVFPSGTIDIIQNGEYDVAEYEKANVNLPVGNGNFVVDTLPSPSNSIQYYIEEIPSIKVGASLSFNGCVSLKKISEIDTSNITNAASMFLGCTKLEKVPKMKITSKVSNIASMFRDCRSLKEIDTSEFDTSNVVNMSSVFRGCNELPSIDLSTFNTSSVTDMGYMFNSCYNLAELDLSSFDTSNLKNVTNMFESCSLLKEMDLSMLNFSGVGTNTDYLFRHCRVIEKIKLPSTVSHLGSQAFYNCDKLNVVILNREVPPTITSTTFFNTPYTLKIYVPDNSVNTYKTTTGWKDQSDKIYPISEYTGE